MVRTSRAKSVSQVSDSQEKSRSKRAKIQDGRPSHDSSGNCGKQSPVSGSMNMNRSKGMHSSPLNSSASRKLPSLPTEVNSPIISESEDKLIEHPEPIQEECALVTCNKEVKESDNAVCCNKCNRWFHQACAGFTQTEYKLLNKKGKNQVNLMWFCDGCIPQLRCFLQGRLQSPSASGSPKSDQMMSSEMGKKMDKVIKGFERLEKAMVATCKENNIENLIEEKVEKYLNEQRDKNDRHSNLIFHNIPESDEVDIADRKEHDVDQVLRIFRGLEVDYTEVRNPIRLGRKPSQDDGNRVRPRLLKVTVDGECVKKQILTKAKQLKTTDFKEWNNITSTSPLT